MQVNRFYEPLCSFIFSTGSIGVFFKYSSMCSFVYIISPTLQAGNIYLPTPTWRLSIVAEVCRLQNYKGVNSYMALKKGGFGTRLQHLSLVLSTTRSNDYFTTNTGQCA